MSYVKIVIKALIFITIGICTFSACADELKDGAEAGSADESPSALALYDEKEEASDMQQLKEMRDEMAAYSRDSMSGLTEEWHDSSHR